MTAALAGALLLAARPANAQAASSGDWMESLEQWAGENLDEDLLRVLTEPDQRKTREALQRIQRRFQGEYVFDLAQLKTTVRALLPILEQYEETLPYAVWIRARLDYLDVAETVTPKAKPGGKTARVTATALRDVWAKQIQTEPWPEKAKPYVKQLKPVFEAERMPPELVWIAEVESSFDPRAKSPAGAAGLFQLMPETAKRYGLRTWPFDQRLQPEPSARAAAQYLRFLYQRYKDWRLALAAYNAGEGTIDRLLAGQKTRTYDAIASRLPAETQMYVPKVEATLARREGVRLERLETRAG